jgi:hypothetical protein
MLVPLVWLDLTPRPGSHLLYRVTSDRTLDA